MMPCTSQPLDNNSSARYEPSCPVIPVMSALFAMRRPTSLLELAEQGKSNSRRRSKAFGLSFNAGIVRAEKEFCLRVEADGLGRAERIHGRKFMSAHFQFAQYLLAGPFFDLQFVGLPLVVEPWLGERGVHRHAEVDDIDDRQQRLADNGRATGRPHGKDRPA